ncbi:hypothetical protein HQ531_12800 [bacterium]|nr:hypothetical protein [bacterium]
MVNLLVYAFAAVCMALIVNSEDDDTRKSGKDVDKPVSKYPPIIPGSGKHYSWTKYEEDPDTGDYRKHKIDIDID